MSEHARPQPAPAVDSAGPKGSGESHAGTSHADQFTSFTVQSFHIDSWLLFGLCYLWGHVGIGFALVVVELAVGFWSTQRVTLTLLPSRTRVQIGRSWPYQRREFTTFIENAKVEHWSASISRGVTLHGSNLSLTAAAGGLARWKFPDRAGISSVPAPFVPNVRTFFRNVPSLAVGAACIHAGLAAQGWLAAVITLGGAFQMVKSVALTCRGVPKLSLRESWSSPTSDISRDEFRAPESPEASIEPPRNDEKLKSGRRQAHSSWSGILEVRR